MVSARASSTTGPSASPTPVEMMPWTQSTFSCCTSLLKRSMVSLGEVSSSMTSSILRPAMPPAALKRSAAHCVARMPFSPGAAAIPERGAKMPMRTGLFCAIAGATTSPEAANAPAAAADLSKLRRDRDMEFLPGCGLLHARFADEGVDLLAGERPIVVEIGDDLFHERLGHSYRALLVAQTIEQNGKRELLRAVALVGPLEAEFGEALDLVVLVEVLAVDRD